MPVPLIAMGAASLISTGAGIYTGIKQREEQKEFTGKQKSLQEKKQKQQLSERKKRIDLMRKQLLGPSLFGGRRSLRTGSERGLTAQPQQREVLG
ncbi:MAG TPA: hypothetical protein VMW66_06180 [Elusimicrobiales bacterium]|nr:hypothetical protein [Elusimicrobiales bacterium]